MHVSYVRFQMGYNASNFISPKIINNLPKEIKSCEEMAYLKKSY